MKRFLSFLLLCVLVLSCSSDDSPTQPGTLLIYVGIGASDAVGVGASPLTAGYVFLIANDLRQEREVELINLGEIGARAGDMVARQLGPAIDAQPGLITVWTGSNDIIAGDSTTRFEDDLDQLLGDLAERTQAEIFVGDLVDLTQVPRFVEDPDPDVTRDRVDAFNQIIRDTAARYSIHVVPLSAMPLTPDLFSIDGFHPSNNGHRAIADTFLAEIDRVL